MSSIISSYNLFDNMFARVVVMAGVSILAWSQAPAPTPAEPPAQPLPATSVPQGQPPAETASPPVLENTGKPIRVAFQCTEDDIRSFGMTCTQEDPCPVFLDLASVAGVGARIWLTGNFHNGAATMYSVLMASDDGGKTWQETHERIRAAGLDLIQFVDFETGWVSGHHLAALPRDPFLLVTTDGGKSWRLRPIFGESRVGSIEQFWFGSRTSGDVLIDRTQAGEAGSRYEHYESQTGGESWMVREVSSRPLRLKGVSSQPSDLRLGTQKATKSHVVERRVGTRWQPLALFLVQAGGCKPEVTAFPEPAPVEPEPPKPEGATAAPKPAAKPPSRPPTLKKPRP